MANDEQLRILQQGAEAWNKWRTENPNPGLVDLSGAKLIGARLNSADLRCADFSRAKLIAANFIGANLCGANLDGADLRNSNLSGANLNGAGLIWAQLSGSILDRADLNKACLMGAQLNGTKLNRAILNKAYLIGAQLNGADLIKAKLIDADLNGANLSRANLIEAELTGADLRGASLLETNLSGAVLSGCKIYGISAWGVKLEGAKQDNLVITPANQPTITVDNLEVAQFIYLLLNNEKIRDVIDTITSKTVLILGRFTDSRKPILEALKKELRLRDYLPILFDFEKASNRDIAETVSTLAHMARFVIADITEAKSVPAELERFVPKLPSVPVQPVILSSDYDYALFEGIKRYPWVLPVCSYDDQAKLIESIKEKIIEPAEEKVNELKADLDRKRCV